MRGWRAGAAFAGCLLAAVALGGWGAGSAAGEPAAALDKPRVTAFVHVTKQEGEDPDEEAKIIAALEEQGYFRPEVPLSYPLQDALHTACERHGVSYAVALGLIQVESGFDPAAVGPDGHDIGLFQIRSSNHAWLTRETGADPQTPDGNIVCGVWMLSYLMEQYDSIEAALTAYRWGHDNGSRIYANEVMHAAEHWR